MAAEVVAELFGGTSKSRDGVGAADGMHDFDLELPDGNCIALEVTTIADENVIEFHEVLADAATWAAAPQLKTDWLVAFPDPVGGGPVIKIKPRKPAIIDALQALEGHGVQMLGPEALEPHVPLGFDSACRTGIDRKVDFERGDARPLVWSARGRRGTSRVQYARLDGGESGSVECASA